MSKRIWAIFLAILATINPQDTMAQISVTGTMPVSVRLEVAPDPPLVISTLTTISFGTVRIPNRLRAGSTCIYALNADDRITVSELNGNTTLASTESGCAVVVPGHAGVAMINCDRDRLVSLTITTQSAQVPNLSYSTNATERVSTSAGVSSSSNRFACTGGQAYLRIGGRLTVPQGSNSLINENINLANLQLTVSYP